MKTISNLQVDTSDMPVTEATRVITVTGEVGAKFFMYIVQDDTLKYYDFLDGAFELGHNNKNNNLEVEMSNKHFYRDIAFPAGGGSYTITLVTKGLTAIAGSNKSVISKNIAKQASNATVTFKAVTASTGNYATFPTTTATGGLADVANLIFNWDVTNATTDAGGFGLRLTGDPQDIDGSFWYFTTTDTVDGDVSPSDIDQGRKVRVDDLTDIGVGSQISAVSSGSLVTTATVTNIDIASKTLTLSTAQTFADGITLTFVAKGILAINNAIGCLLSFPGVTAVLGAPLTQTVRANVSNSTTVTLSDTQGVTGGNLIKYKGVGVSNASSNRVTSVTPDPGGSDGDLSLIHI